MPAIALVGAGTRLGLSLGRVFGKHGFDVALVARSAEGLGELAEKLAAEGVKAAGFPADVTDRPTLIAALDRAAARFGGIEVLQYSAPYVHVGDTGMTGVLDVTVENLRPQVEGSCYGAITATRAVLPRWWRPAQARCCTPRAPARSLQRRGPAAPALPALPYATGPSTSTGRWLTRAFTSAMSPSARGSWARRGCQRTRHRWTPDAIADMHWDMHIARNPAERLITP